jgi:hypothetical protein
MTDHFQKTLELLDSAEQRQRDEARRTAQANHEPEQQDAARWLADRLQANASRWLTLEA